MDESAIQQKIETVFNEVMEQRMQESPLLNRNLQVQAVGFQPYREHWLGIVITPWFMNLMLLPGQTAAWDNKQCGEKLRVKFPSGEFEFAIGIEHVLGRYAVCSLFSPMFQFEQQAAAVIAAEAVLQALLAEPAAQHGISRRDLLRGAFGGRNIQA